MSTITLTRSLPAINLHSIPFEGILSLFRLWTARAAQRRQLAELEAWQRQDIGLSPDQIREETAKPIWRA